MEGHGKRSETAAPEINAPQFRSRVTNGRAVLPGVDGRSLWARRLRDVMGLHIADMGGEDAISEAEKSIVRRASTLTVELELLEVRFATNGQATPEDLDLYQRVTNTHRRLMESIGLKRRPREIVDLHDYVRQTSAGAPA